MAWLKPKTNPISPFEVAVFEYGDGFYIQRVSTGLWWCPEEWCWFNHKGYCVEFLCQKAAIIEAKRLEAKMEEDARKAAFIPRRVWRV